MLPRHPLSSTMVVLRIALIVFTVEALIMLVLITVAETSEGVLDRSEWLLPAIDAILLVALSSPLIHLWVIRPFVESRNQALEVLRHSETRLNKAQSLAHVGSWEHDHRDGLLTWSSEIYRIFGIAPDAEVVSYRTFLEAVHPADRDMVHQAHCRTRVERQPIETTFRLCLPDGGTRWVHEHCQTEFSGNGQPLISRGTIQDVSKRIEQENQLIRLAEDLDTARHDAEAANRAKSQFIAMMSHELRTPLNAVIGFSEIMRDDALGPAAVAKYREYAGDIHASGRHLLALINDILDLSKVESGRDELIEQVIDIGELLDATRRLVGPHASQASVRLQIEFAPDLPLLLADNRKLKQILVNLLSNAIKFSPDGGTVLLRAGFDSDAGFSFEITDQGIGMTQAEIPKALSLFGQVHSGLDRKYEGTGLGLPLTKALAEQHGGTLHLESQSGVGTTARIVLPATRAVAREAPSGSLPERELPRAASA